MARAGIICTIGPSSQDVDVLKEMIRAGMNIARLNFSHGVHEEHQEKIDCLRQINTHLENEIKFLQDLRGFRLRIGAYNEQFNKPFELTLDQSICLTNQDISKDAVMIPLEYDGPLDAVKVGYEIYIDDGNIALETEEVTDEFIICRVVTPGILKEHKGVNIPDAKFPFKVLTEKDIKDIEFGIKNEVDFIAQSFVRNRQDIIDIKNILKERNFRCKLIAKIENKEGIENIDEIIESSDGIMIARGDMGVSLPIYKVPVIQKLIIKKCLNKRKIVITATQMLESMTIHNKPTRAEVSDVANAVLDGSDYVMLSGETAVGQYPVEAVDMMQSIIDFTEYSETSALTSALD